MKALDYVIKINGDGNDMDPESLLHACIDKVDTIELTLQRDLGNNMCWIERENAIAYVREDFVIACLLP